MPNEVISYTELIARMEDIKQTCGRVDGFVIPMTIQQEWLNSADLFEEVNRQHEAVRVGLNAVKGLRGLLDKFLRNATPRFEALVAKRGQNDYYDEDIIAGLNSKFRKFDEAIRIETNGTFDKRIETYSALKSGICWSDEEQARRHEKRKREKAEREEAERVARAALIAEANRVAAEEQRQRAIAERKQIADKARSLFG